MPLMNLYSGKRLKYPTGAGGGGIAAVFAIYVSLLPFSITAHITYFCYFLLISFDYLFHIHFPFF